MLKLVVLACSVNVAGGITVSDTDTVLLMPLPVAVIVIGDVPRVAEPLAVNVRTAEPDPFEVVMLDGLNVAVTPEGRLLVANVTGPEKGPDAPYTCRFTLPLAL